MLLGNAALVVCIFVCYLFQRDRLFTLRTFLQLFEIAQPGLMSLQNKQSDTMQDCLIYFYLQLCGTFAALPGSAASQACFMALISSSFSVSFFTSILPASLWSLTTRRVQWGLLSSKLCTQINKLTFIELFKMWGR